MKELYLWLMKVICDVSVYDGAQFFVMNATSGMSEAQMQMQQEMT